MFKVASQFLSDNLSGETDFCSRGGKAVGADQGRETSWTGNVSRDKGFATMMPRIQVGPVYVRRGPAQPRGRKRRKRKEGKRQGQGCENWPGEILIISPSSSALCVGARCGPSRVLSGGHGTDGQSAPPFWADVGVMVMAVRDISRGCSPHSKLIRSQAPCHSDRQQTWVFVLCFFCSPISRRGACGLPRSCVESVVQVAAVTPRLTAVGCSRREQDEVIPHPPGVSGFRSEVPTCGSCCVLYDLQRRGQTSRR